MLKRNRVNRNIHNKFITACGKLIVTVLVSRCDFGGRDPYNPAFQSFARLVLISFAERLRILQYEMFG
ncbi:MAG: hypothetical protein K9M81_02605 [Chthoniobacterales bacterium]|nr:hypothetical protein [Chthoniobacterales bacterium]